MAIYSKTEPAYIEADGELVPLTAERLAAEVLEQAGGVEAVRGPEGPRGPAGRDGDHGPPGEPGRDGADGGGVPDGGSTGQVLAKRSAARQDTTWVTPLALGTTSMTALRGDYSPPVDAPAGTASLRRLGSGALEAAPGPAAVPAGGADGQVLMKYAAADYAFTWSGFSRGGPWVTHALRRLGTGPGEAAPGVDAVGRIAHGADAAAARPEGYALVIWIGSVEPTNASRGDLWVRTAA